MHLTSLSRTLRVPDPGPQVSQLVYSGFEACFVCYPIMDIYGVKEEKEWDEEVKVCIVLRRVCTFIRRAGYLLSLRSRLAFSHSLLS